jgi:hypothetical protein
MDKRRKSDEHENRAARDESAEKENERHGSSNKDSNPPRTTSKGWMTTPKFGSSTSGGGELEPGPERD